MMRRGRSVVLGAVLLAIAAPGRGVEAGWAFFGLGPGGDDGGSSRAWAVSADGRTVVGERSSPGGPEAFRWTAEEGMVGLGGPSGSAIGGAAYGVSADGSVVVGATRSAGGVREAFRWTAGGGLVRLGEGSEGVAFGVSADGSVVVGARVVPDPFEEGVVTAFRWTEAGGLTDLSPPAHGPAGSRSAALGVSADGSVVVGRFSTSGPFDDLRAGIWTADRGWDAPLGRRDQDDTGQATAASADGSIVVGSASAPTPLPEQSAFRWERPSGAAWISGLGEAGEPSPFGNAIASAVSADGRTIVGTIHAPGLPADPSLPPALAMGSRAFYWDPIVGFRVLDEWLAEQGVAIDGWTLLEARGISADGRAIVGTGIDPSGQVRAWLVRFDLPVGGPLPGPAIPEPSSLVLVGLGALSPLLLVGRRRAGGAV